MMTAPKLISALASLWLTAAATAGPALAEGKADKLTVPSEKPAAEPLEETETTATVEQPAAADDDQPRGPVSAKHFAEDVCAIIARESKRRGLPPTFLARLIWRESTFDAEAVSPKGAQGIAQFMPFTASERGLKDPFAPHQALPASAHLLHDLKSSLGNLGLAAAAYNAGEKAVSDWVAGNRSLPYETQEYVAFITGQPAENWISRDSDHPIPSIGKDDANFDADCIRLVKRQLAPRDSGARVLNLGGGGRAAWKPWGVVLSGGFNERRAVDAFNRIKSRYGSILGGKKPMVARKKNTSRGKLRLVSVMVGHDNRETADQMCKQLLDLGAACMVLKNTR